jgi:hypothetical protein
MTQSKRLFAILFGSLLLSACGGGGAKDLSGGGTDPDTDPTKAASVVVTTQACTDATNGTGCTATTSLSAAVNNRVEVLVVDANKKAVDKAFVSATTTIGTLSPSTALTNSSGVAVFVLSAPAANSNSAGTVTAIYTDESDKSVPGKQNFTFVPGQSSSDDFQLKLSLLACENVSDLSTCSEQSRLPSSQTSLVQATLLDPSGNPVVDAIVKASVSVGTLATTSGLTNSEGKVTFKLNSSSDSSEEAGTVTVTSTVASGSLATSKNYMFGASDLAISLVSDSTTLNAGSVAVLTASVTQNGIPYNYPIAITFSSSCASSNKATLDSQVTAYQGTALATYKGSTDTYACAGNDTIIATAAGVDTTASVTITNLTAATRSITAATPSPEFIYLRGSGKDEKATITFTLLDAQAKPVSGKKLNFSFAGTIRNNANYQDYTLSPISATTNTDGKATVTVNSGNLPSPISVIATLDENKEIRAGSSQIGVGIGYADDDSFSFAATAYNINGAGHDGETAKITIRLADRFNNPVANGTKVYFTTEGGSIAGDLSSGSGDTTGVCSTAAGLCTATLTSQDPRPADGRLTVSAYVAGEESFKDLNGNGIFDKSELVGVTDDQLAADVPDYVRNYSDVGEPFTDYNVDDSSAADADVDYFRLGVDTFQDLNGNSSRDTGDGVYTGLVCDTDTIARGFCLRNLTTLFRNVEFVFTGVDDSAAGVGVMPIQVYDAGARMWRSDINVDLTTGAKYVRILPMHIPHDASLNEDLRLANPIPDSLKSSANFGDLSINLHGVNPIPAGSKFTITNDNGGAVKNINVDYGNCGGVDIGAAYPSVTRPFFYCLIIEPEAEPNKKKTGTLNIKVETSGGFKDAMTAAVGVIDNG